MGQVCSSNRARLWLSGVRLKANRIVIVAARKKEKRQTVCKPGSVLLAAETTRMDGHSSGTPVAGRLSQPTRTAARKPACRTKPACRPYLVLLPVGFALPPPFPAARCALTTPFHPYPPSPKLWRAVYFLWHFPWGRPRRVLPGTVSPWSPDFPPPHTKGHEGDHPTVWQGKYSPDRH